MNRIQSIRVAAGIRQIELAEHIGWAQSRVSNYETGQRVPGLDDARTLVRALNRLGAQCTLDDVFPSDDAEAA
ncbi:helix-turn-helix transcriptional regulator [Alcanivorax sp. ZXX171]|nr:helix-turn-helix transcriptional regulator [Alcanivorax sp. ZXX171]